MLIAIEGIDGSGKGTQAELLRTRVEHVGLRAAVFSFPQYGANPFSAAVSWYLNGRFGTVNEVSPYLAAVLYAGDRFAARFQIEQAENTCDFVICDRYVPSNLAHQAAKLPASERDEFLAWLSDVEYGVFRLPEPTISVFLDMPGRTAQLLVSQKGTRTYTTLRADIHERSSEYLDSCIQVYRQLIQRRPEAWILLNCTTQDGELRTPAEIADELWRSLQPRLAVVTR